MHYPIRPKSSPGSNHPRFSFWRTNHGEKGLRLKFHLACLALHFEVLDSTHRTSLYTMLRFFRRCFFFPRLRLYSTFIYLISLMLLFFISCCCVIFSFQFLFETVLLLSRFFPSFRYSTKTFFYLSSCVRFFV